MSDTPTTPAPRYLPYLNDAATILNLACAPGTDPAAVAVPSFVGASYVVSTLLPSR